MRDYKTAIALVIVGSFSAPRLQCSQAGSSDILSLVLIDQPPIIISQAASDEFDEAWASILLKQSKTIAEFR